MSKIIYTPAGDVVLSFPYVRGFIDELKHRIPRSYRSYDPDTKRWRVDCCYADEAEELFYRYFPDAKGSHYTAKAQAPALPDWCLTLYVLPSAPRPVVDAAYKALSKIYHPDTATGSHEKMKQLNSAIEQARGAAR